MHPPRGFRSSRADAPDRVARGIATWLPRTLLLGTVSVLIASAGAGCEQPSGKKDSAERWFDDRPPTWDRWPGSGHSSGSQTPSGHSGTSAGSNTSSSTAANTTSATNANQHTAGSASRTPPTSQTSKPKSDDAPARSRSLLVGPGDPRLGPVPIDRVVNASGLVIEDLVRGEGATCLPGMRIRVRYTAAVLDGRVFDRADGDPVSLDLDDCVHAWRQGLPGMRVGGVRQLISPPSLAFGDDTLVDDNDRVIVPASSAIVFVVELLDIDSGGT